MTFHSQRWKNRNKTKHFSPLVHDDLSSTPFSSLPLRENAWLWITIIKILSFDYGAETSFSMATCWVTETLAATQKWSVINYKQLQYFLLLAFALLQSWLQLPWRDLLLIAGVAQILHGTPLCPADCNHKKKSIHYTVLVKIHSPRNANSEGYVAVTWFEQTEFHWWH